jgi:mRNA interferase RelE/StbE
MPYQVIIKPQAEKAILELQRKDQENVFREIRAIAVDPKKTGVKPLRHELKGLWKSRVGNYRIVFRIEEGRLLILVIAVGDRKEIYRTVSRMKSKD